MWCWKRNHFTSLEITLLNYASIDKIMMFVAFRCFVVSLYCFYDFFFLPLSPVRTIAESKWCEVKGKHSWDVISFSSFIRSHLKVTLNVFHLFTNLLSHHNGNEAYVLPFSKCVYITFHYIFHCSTAQQNKGKANNRRKKDLKR